MTITKSHLTFGQITKLQLTRSYKPTDWALAWRGDLSYCLRLRNASSLSTITTLKVEEGLELIDHHYA